jgi:hypothetical protein
MVNNIRQALDGLSGEGWRAGGREGPPSGFAGCPDWSNTLPRGGTPDTRSPPTSHHVQLHTHRPLNPHTPFSQPTLQSTSCPPLSSKTAPPCWRSRQSLPTSLLA